ncbi:MAG: phage tail protein [Nocardioidaceae bacterium]|nr:phage tail protein [Nocardioidaceae bacterium]
MSDPYIGEIRMFGGNFAPNGWLFCQGQLVPISDYDTLFNLIGTTYGGDGQETFALPNLASRIPVHQGSLPGGHTYQLGETGGLEEVTISSNQMPAHHHVPPASSSPGRTTSPNNAYWAGSSDGLYTSSAPDVSMAPTALATAGGNQPHDNMPPYLVVNFIISMYGIYPSPS